MYCVRIELSIYLQLNVINCHASTECYFYMLCDDVLSNKTIVKKKLQLGPHFAFIQKKCNTIIMNSF